MSVSALTIKDPTGAVISVEVGDTDEMFDHLRAQLLTMPRGTKFQMNHLRIDDEVAEGGEPR